jgi:hypothetical protein
MDRGDHPDFFHPQNRAIFQWKKGKREKKFHNGHSLKVSKIFQICEVSVFRHYLGAEVS